MKKIKITLVTLLTLFLITSPFSQKQANAEEMYDLKKSVRVVITNEEGETVGTMCIFCDPSGICTVIACAGGPIIRL